MVWAPNTPAVNALVAVVHGRSEARLVGLPEFFEAGTPCRSLVLPSAGDLLIGEVSGPPGSRMSFIEMVFTSTGLRSKAPFGARGFDGRAILLDCEDHPVVTTAAGIRPLFTALDAPNRCAGVVETYALDSQRYGCAWHRIFLEVCLPPGTSIVVEARTADDLYPDGVSRAPNPPAAGAPPDVDTLHFPLGSRLPYPVDVEGWVPLGYLRSPGRLGRRPFPPPAPASTETMEGLVKNAPGRYLWLRIHLVGTKRQTPALLAVRATFPRPSLLAYLPAFGRPTPTTPR